MSYIIKYSDRQADAAAAALPLKSRNLSTLSTLSTFSAFCFAGRPWPLARPGKEAAQKSRFRCFVLASLRTSREALLYIWGVPMFVMFINYKHYNHWHTPNVK